MTACDQDRLPLVLGGGIAAVVVALGAAALLLGPGRAGPPAAGGADEALSVPLGGGASGGPAREARQSPAPAGSDTVVVTMTNGLQFTPDSVRIQAGTTVVWKNTSDLIHTSTDDPAREARQGDAVLPDGAEPWDSGQLEPGRSFAHTFTVPGTYHYFCIPHEPAGMRGVIRVGSGSP